MFYSFLKEENLYYRQRQSQQQQHLIENAESIPNFQQPSSIGYSQQQAIYLINDASAAGHDQTIAIEQQLQQQQIVNYNSTNFNDQHNFTNHNNNNNNYAQIKQQHHVSHSKMHSLDRFAVPANLVPQPAPQRHNNHHEHLTGLFDFSFFIF
jgi:hypothetical protein